METCAQLVALLAEQSAVMRQIIAVTEKEIEAFAAADPNGLLNAATQQEKLAAHLVDLERERNAVQEKLEAELSLPRQCKLGELAAFLPAEFKECLARLKEELEREASLLVLLQARLYFLIERAMAVEERVARLLCGWHQKKGCARGEASVMLVNHTV